MSVSTSPSSLTPYDLLDTNQGVNNALDGFERNSLESAFGGSYLKQRNDDDNDNDDNDDDDNADRNEKEKEEEGEEKEDIRGRAVGSTAVPKGRISEQLLDIAQTIVSLALSFLLHRDDQHRHPLSLSNAL